MTAHTSTDNNDVADVRSAWDADAVKFSVTVVAISSAATMAAVAGVLKTISTGNSAVAAVCGGAIILNGAFAVRYANQIRRTLSELPAPRS